MTTLQNLTANTNVYTQLNENFDAVSPAGMYGKRAPATTGLTWGYYGGRGFGNTIADGTVVLTASATNYLVANRTTGAVSASTSITNWNDTSGYYRLYLIVTGTASVTSATDYREFAGGGSTGGGMSNPMTAAGDIIYGGTPSAGVAPPTRLAAGTNGYILTIVSGLPAWQPAPASGFSNPMTTIGDLIVGGASGAATRYAAGASGLVLTSNGAGVAPTWQTPSGAGLANWTESVSTAAPNATVPVVRFTATNAATDVDAALIPKGAGAILRATPDSTTTGGNKRGNYAVDLQSNLSRSNAANVASGAQSAILGGSNNRASGVGSVVPGGQNNIASGTNALAMGGSCSATSDYSVALGATCLAQTGTAAIAIGSQTTSSGTASIAMGTKTYVSGSYSVATGVMSYDRGIQGAAVHSSYDDSGTSGTQPTIQYGRYNLSGVTSSTTPIVLTANHNNSLATSNSITVPANCSMFCEGTVLARGGSPFDNASWKFTALMSRDAGNVALVGTPVVTPQLSSAGSSGWAIAISVNTATQCLVVTCTGPSGISVNWGCVVQTIEVKRS